MQKSVNTTLKTAPDFLPNIRIKHDESAEISALVDEFLNRGGSIKTTSKPTVFISEFGRKPSIAPVDTAVWQNKNKVLYKMKTYKVLVYQLAIKAKVPKEQLSNYLKGLLYPSLETQERIESALDLFILSKQKQGENHATSTV
jgi:hypothetical protein